MTPEERLARDEASPALVRLHRALSRLGSVVTLMNTGAHPDDEQSGLLAWLRFGRGMRVVVACSTRGEGGQNVLGPERGGALGLLRTREMEEAARILDCDIAWLGFGPQDPVHDFGFSKDGDDTFARWGEDRIVERLVRAYRRNRPDIVLPTFLDVPGQHGHHRAMTRAAETAVARAADPAAYPHHMDEGLTPWTVTKLYLPAWPGGGGTYDDEVPPPEATLTERATGRDPATGADFARIGEWSRRRHASQGMGRWHDEAQMAWPLHLCGGDAEAQITDGLPVSLRDLADLLPAAANDLSAAGEAIDSAGAAFPDPDAILAALAQADAALDRAARAIAGDTEARAAHGHRIAVKRRDVQTAMVEASGLDPRLDITDGPLAPGGSALLTLRTAAPFAAVSGMTVTPVLPQGVSARPETSGEAATFALSARDDAPFTPQFAATWSATGGNAPIHVRLDCALAGRQVSTLLDPATPAAVAPAAPFEAEPADFLHLRAAPPAPFAFRYGGAISPGETDLPEGWTLTLEDGAARLTPAADLSPGLTRIVPRVQGRPAMRRSVSHYPHIGRLAYDEDAALRILSLDLALPEDTRIGWIGGGSDRTDLWIRRMGLDVTTLDRIAQDTDLSAYTTLVIGVVALAARPDVLAHVARLHDFVRAGGALVTLYQRPDQGWDPDSVPPLPLTIGTPSLRWRVTDEAAPVTVLKPDHPILTTPNAIGPADWEGWDKERGLYFAAAWDDAYVPLLSMHDRGEAPLTGALVSARIGAGRHTHVSLVLHHQLERMVPGAFRLLANILRPER
ncbi:PIG-L family deacetylase [Mesobaculum littorinae]|uniref:PIG-L family deacetylase n=1 Tax=Mesobaculum littorinae TaxID=2486419 RepID=A0A438AFS8_9RHOB|nr:PIG-L family deacetylase [Mesobaculum littorinae]RVV97570.1 PIG-L family deacetylase [Mesobaculum littorinae]